MNDLDAMREQILTSARKTLNSNIECFIAHWVLQNPDENFKDYTLCIQNDWSNEGGSRYWLDKKDKHD